MRNWSNLEDLEIDELIRKENKTRYFWGLFNIPLSVVLLFILQGKLNDSLYLSGGMILYMVIVFYFIESKRNKTLGQANMIYRKIDWFRIIGSLIVLIILSTVFMLNLSSFLVLKLVVITLIISQVYIQYSNRFRYYLITETSIYDLKKAKKLIKKEDIKAIHITENEISIDTIYNPRDLVMLKDRLINTNWQEINNLVKNLEQ